MDHVVYLDYKARELENLKSGDKTMIIRGAMGRKLPHGRCDNGDILYFIENKGDGLVKAKAEIKKVFHSEQLSPQQSTEIVMANQLALILDKAMMKRFAGKRYLVLITLKDFEELQPFRIDRSMYSNMDDWLPIVKIDGIKI